MRLFCVVPLCASGKWHEFVDQGLLEFSVAGQKHLSPYTCIIAKQRCINYAQIENNSETD